MIKTSRIDSVNFPDILSWMKKRGTFFKDFPPVGLKTDHVAIWIVETNSHFCLLEPMITNPESSSKEINESLTLIINELLEYATRTGYDIAYGMTKHQSVIEYAKRNGFEISETPFLLERIL